MQSLTQNFGSMHTQWIPGSVRDTKKEPGNEAKINPTLKILSVSLCPLIAYNGSSVQNKGLVPCLVPELY